MGLREPALEVPYFALRCACVAWLVGQRRRLCGRATWVLPLGHGMPRSEVGSWPAPTAANPAVAELSHATPRHAALSPPSPQRSWYMTWFAHDVPQLSQAARLFDLFLSSHPLMPLYVAAVAIKASALCGRGWLAIASACRVPAARRSLHASAAQVPLLRLCLPRQPPLVPASPERLQGNRQQVLACGDDGLAAYATLKSMRFLQPGQPSADELAQQAAALYQAVPPARLARRRGIRLEHSAAIDAFLRCARLEGVWGCEGGASELACQSCCGPCLAHTQR